jgi:hypothetical protein
MRKVLLLIMLLIGLTSFSQEQKKDSVRYTSVGNELIQFEKQYSTGIGLSTIGLGVVFVGSTQQQKSLVVIGGITCLIGTFITIQSHSHIRNAGILLNENGIGVKIKL